MDKLKDADDASVFASASSESTLAEISFELSRNSISISIKWFYSESNAATRRCRWPNQQQQQQRTNTFESDAPIQPQLPPFACVGKSKSSDERRERESEHELRFPLVLVCEEALTAAAAPSTTQ